MKKHVKIAAVLFLGLSVMTSCVSKKKYEELEAQKMDLNNQLDQAKSDIQDLENTKEELENRSAELEDEVADLSSSLEQTKTQVKTVETEREAAVSKLTTIKDEISDVLMEDENIDLEEKDGKLYLTLGDDILYRFGSSRISSDGKSVIDNVASIIQNHSDVKIIIESHTDNRMMKEGAPYRDNWDLSVARSANVVRQLVKSGVAPEQLLAAGKGEYDPVVEGDGLSIEDLEPNRRTEFIILPDVRPLISISKNINP
ncbi:OmpA/MotB family protein [Membranihabitans maritimus]|uniref:OmpA/MotB family protein n=1 Tax=Membranihabitans maritimus TaxID=2904244 RepID=UPI001F2ACE52|nr:OmpA family protein [Membranihabitans maritimus]